MEYDELIEKIKEALKITRKLELYEKMDWRTFLKKLGETVMIRVSTKPKKTRKKNTILRF